MENDYALMVVFTVLVICVSASELIKAWIKTHAAQRLSQNKQNQEVELAKLAEENSRLKDRVSVLERIVTESDYQLKREINQL